MNPAHLVILAALVIGLIYGAVGLVSGFCLMSSLRGWWADGDGRLIRTYALAMGTGIAASQLLAAYDLVDLGKSIYLQPTFSAPLMFFGGLFHLEGYTSPRHMLRSAGGAALMGVGGAMAYGCSVGQGLTGLSTLALASFVAVAGILLGTAAGLRGALGIQPLVAETAR